MYLKKKFSVITNKTKVPVPQVRNTVGEVTGTICEAGNISEPKQIHSIT